MEIVKRNNCEMLFNLAGTLRWTIFNAYVIPVHVQGSLNYNDVQKVQVWRGFDPFIQKTWNTAHLTKFDRL